MSTQNPAPSTTLAVQSQSAPLWTTGPMPIDWPPSPACYLFTCAELTMMVNIAKGKVGEDGKEWRCDGCHEAFEYSPGLFYHIVKDEKCGAWLSTVKFTVGQMLAVLAAVDYEGVEDLVEGYVYRWENLNFPDSEYATTPLAPAPSDSSNSYSSSSSSSVNGIRVFPKKVPARRPLPGSQHPRVRTPSTPASSTSSIMSVSVISADVAEAEANCYDANHNKFMQLNIGTGPNCDGTIAHFAEQNIFPLAAPDALFDNDVDKYDKLLDRIRIFAAHRLHYLAPNSNRVSQAGSLITDWNATMTAEGNKKYKTYPVWQSRRAHDLKDIKDLLM